jgi:hypothetical protein
MKKITLLILIIVAFASNIKNANAQISVGHVYPDAGRNLTMVNLENDGQKYCWQDWTGSRVVLYNLDYSIFKIMPLPIVNSNNTYARYIFHVSRNLFDCTSDETGEKIEYMYVYVDSSYLTNTVIADELGSVFFFVQGMNPLCVLWPSVYNTPTGAKMILSPHQPPYNAIVYDLCGTLPTSVESIGSSSHYISSLSAFPNPSSEQATIEYQFPPGITSGEIILYDINGLEVKRYIVDSTFNNLLLDNTALYSGTYFYQLTAGGNIIGTKKMVVVK